MENSPYAMLKDENGNYTQDPLMYQYDRANETNWYFEKQYIQLEKGYTTQVARSWRKFSDGQYENYTTEVYDYWHGEGTSNRYPLLAPGNSGQNFQAISDIYIDDADYVRIQNLTIGYDFKRIWKNGLGIT